MPPAAVPTSLFSVQMSQCGVASAIWQCNPVVFVICCGHSLCLLLLIYLCVCMSFNCDSGMSWYTACIYLFVAPRNVLATFRWVFFDDCEVSGILFVVAFLFSGYDCRD